MSRLFRKCAPLSGANVYAARREPRTPGIAKTRSGQAGSVSGGGGLLGDAGLPLAATGGFTGRCWTNNIKVIRSCTGPGGLPSWRRAAGSPAFPVSEVLPVAEARPEMSQAIVNPEELRRFAARLKQFNNEMIGQLTTLHGQLAGLSQTWRDREHDKFVEQFEQTLQVVKRFTESTNQHIPFLLRKAERIEEYLQQR